MTKMLFCVLLCVALLGCLQVEADDLGYFWQFTDLHLETGYQKLGCNGTLGDYNCDSPLALIKSALSHAKALKPDPDFIIWTGDSGPHRRTPIDELTRLVNSLTQEIVATFSDVPIIPLLGNHDVSPANSMVVEDPDTARVSWCTRMAQEWTNFFTSPEQKKLFENNCYHAYTVKKKQDPTKTQYVVLSLNGLAWYANNPLAQPKENETLATYDPLNQFAWMVKQFELARRLEYKVILSSHFPPGASENAPMQFRHMWPLANEKMLNLLIDYSDVILTYLAAHEHVDSFRVVYKEEQPVGTVLLAPSITTFKLSGLGATNPRIRLYTYDRNSSDLLNYEQHVLDLNETDPKWAIDYSAREAYNLEDLSAPQMSKLLTSFKADNSYWPAYYARELGGQGHELSLRCDLIDEQCRRSHLCAMNHIAYDKLHECLSNGPPSSFVKYLVYTLASVLLAALIVIGIVILLRQYTKKNAYAQPITQTTDIKSSNYEDGFTDSTV